MDLLFKSHNCGHREIPEFDIVNLAPNIPVFGLSIMGPEEEHSMRYMNSSVLLIPR